MSPEMDIAKIRGAELTKIDRIAGRFGVAVGSLALAGNDVTWK